jgi:hypothetical protein
MDILEANKYAKTYAPHIYTVNLEYGCVRLERGDIDSGNRYEGLVIKMNENLIRKECKIVSRDQN